MKITNYTRQFIGMMIGILIFGMTIITIFKFGLITNGSLILNKGWKGLTLERLAGLSNDNKQAPNGLGFELKSVAYYQVKGIWTPKETMAITMINPTFLVNHSF